MAIVFHFSRSDVFKALELLVGVAIPEHLRERTCQEIAELILHKLDEVDPLLLIMNLEEIGDVTLGNDDDAFPSMRQDRRKHLFLSIPISKWCDEVANWANSRQIE